MIPLPWFLAGMALAEAGHAHWLHAIAGVWSALFAWAMARRGGAR